MSHETKYDYMKRAIELAELGKGKVNPNPLVGAVIVKDGKIIGEGYHECFGEAHAEVNAFHHAIEDVEGAEMYVTLEPCSHYGKTPPCALKIIEKKIKKVYISQLDPNPLVNGRGVSLLKEAGIDVETGILEEVSKKQNEIFLHYIKTKRPFVAMKYAMTVDGKIATRTKDSKWITNETSRAYVHELRHEYMSIMVGANTVLLDDPHLDTRREGKVSRNPIRIVIDPDLIVPLDRYLIQSAKQQPTWLIVDELVDEKRLDSYKEKGVEFIMMPMPLNMLDLMYRLGERKIDSLIIEGGSFLHAKALESNIVDKAYVFIAPKMVGGKEALTPIGGEGVEKMNQAYALKNMNIHHFGDDLMIEGYFKQGEQP